MHSALITHAGREAISCVERQKGKKSKQQVLYRPVRNCRGNLLHLLFGNDL